MYLIKAEVGNFILQSSSLSSSEQHIIMNRDISKRINSLVPCLLQVNEGMMMVYMVTRACIARGGFVLRPVTSFSLKKKWKSSAPLAFFIRLPVSKRVWVGWLRMAEVSISMRELVFLIRVLQMVTVAGMGTMVAGVGITPAGIGITPVGM
ncbi:hypothetical protein BDR03DRAFT_980254 [Suillus americanus]|nr:hypothetical protein BDR03DRAFT_980254 [Suillus americanus]